MIGRSLRFLSAILCTCLAGCSGEKPPTGNPTPDGGGNPTDDMPVLAKATMAIVQGSASGSVDVYINGDKASFSPLAYKASSGNLMLTPGTYRIDVRAAGAAATSTPAFTLMQSLSASSKVLVVAMGRLGDPPALPTAFALKAFSEATADAGAVKLRLVHAAPGAPPVDLAQASANVAANVAFAAASDYASLSADLQAGAQLGLRSAGKTLDLAFAQTSGVIAKGSVVTAIAVGEIDPLADDDKFLDVISVDESTGAVVDLALTVNTTVTEDQKPSFSFFHASPDTGAVDLRQTGVTTALLANVAYRAAGAVAIKTSPGTVPLEVRLAGGANAIFSKTARFLPTFPWVIVLRGLAAGTTGRERGLSAFLSGLNLSLNGDVVAATEARLRLVNLAPDAPQLELVDGNNMLVAAGAAYLQAGSFQKLTVPLVDLTTNLRAVGTTTNLYRVSLPLATLNLLKGQNVDLLVTGTTTGDVKVLSLRNTVAAQVGVALELTTTKL